jgi:hypothetical protein
MSPRKALPQSNPGQRVLGLLERGTPLPSSSEGQGPVPVEPARAGRVVERREAMDPTGVFQILHVPFEKGMELLTELCCEFFLQSEPAPVGQANLACPCRPPMRFSPRICTFLSHPMSSLSIS